ncbi:MAG: aldehyde dehydrogenase family protein [Fibrobacterales bacterium]
MLKVYSPYDESLIREIPFDQESDAEQALATAYELYTDRSKWIATPERVAILERVIEIMKGEKESLLKIAAGEGGKPWADSEVEVNRAINGVQLALEGISHLAGQQIPMGHTVSSANRMAYTFREPLGVVLSISAFNHPLNLIIHQVIPALAVGCPVIIKPALTTPLSCIAFVDILRRAGLPEGWCQLIVCENDVAEYLVTDERVSYLSFIGSAKVGWYLRSKLAPGTHIALEHGGAAPVIVEKDADIESMIPALGKGAFYHAGQVCVSVQRMFVEQTIIDTVSQKMVEYAEKLVVGDPLDPKTEVGPLILAREVDRVEEWVNEAITAGAQLLSGGKRISNTCYEPTVLLNPPMDVKVSQLEIFGPVVCIYSYSDREQAITQANAVPFSFQAAVFTSAIDTALDVVHKLNAAAVMVNDHTAFRVDWMPFGGRKHSGTGVGGIQYSMHEMTYEKLMVLKSSVL